MSHALRHHSRCLFVVFRLKPDFEGGLRHAKDVCHVALKDDTIGGSRVRCGSKEAMSKV